MVATVYRRAFGLVSDYSKTFLAKTIQTWQPFYDTPLSEEAAREIADNVTNLLLFLAELERKYGNQAQTEA